MAPATRKNDQDAPSPGGERQVELKAQLPKFKGKCDEDVRQWRFEDETLCRINGDDAADGNHTLPLIAGTAMEEPASGGFLFWASRTSADEQT
ncbi:hypothetical protein PPTG_23725 [Phytophthora nicotianae INRA-310]|uniref:Uncharacterized protein n=1 Tax=Phytophthora nicotianae (strain INRA-310) TaxID=761204 RepID=W2PSM8_PHYN3|nr:hypothetical protein PPTG_23725 [Phytophthora nicotianae INRA-310]ETN03937.1 hypothetical protein PPTG_23725 [Phytophthora nicotianae INRA-310]